MRMDKLTSRFQQALADAQSLAVGRDHNLLEPVHVLTALLDQSGGSTRPLLAQAGVNVPLLRERLARLNPEASSRMATRLLEASDRQYWQPDAETLAALQQAALDLEDRMEGIAAE